MKINLELERVVHAMKIQSIERSAQESSIVSCSKKYNASRKREANARSKTRNCSQVPKNV